MRQQSLVFSSCHSTLFPLTSSSPSPSPSPSATMEFDLQNPLSNHLQHSLFAMESDHLTLSVSDLDSDHLLRRQIIAFIYCLSHKLHHPFISYLAVNYLHRFLVTNTIQSEKPWVLKLVALACVSLAKKMISSADSRLSDFQKDGDLMFDNGTVERMELVILGALKWRMRSITPFAFIKFFVSFFKLKPTSPHDDGGDGDDDDHDDDDGAGNGDDQHHHQVLKDRATEIIFKAQIESKLLAFKPSTVAASALLCASHELYPLQFSSFENSISSCSYVNEDDLAKCYSAIQEVVMDGYESILSCKTPINVLDLDYSSSEETHTKPTDPSEEEKRGLKRLKTSTFSKSPFQLS